jgi:hypothetical protein
MKLDFRLWQEATNNFSFFTFEDIAKRNMAFQSGLFETELLKGNINLYTGVNDFCALGIYDKDIIEYKNSKEYGVGIVEFDKGGFIVKWIKQNFNSLMTPMYYLTCEKELRKIGNAYQTPELLD